VQDALRHGAPDRIGYAIAAFSDDAVVAEIAERGPGECVRGTEASASHKASALVLEKEVEDRPVPLGVRRIEHLEDREARIREHRAELRELQEALEQQALEVA
jgi:hypothetical protein